MNNASLKVSDLYVYYGEVKALDGVSAEVNYGSVVAVIGSNGAGKTTLLKAISGLIPIRKGIIEFNQKSVIGLAPHKITELGIVQVPEGRHILSEMTVLENLELGAFLEKKTKRIMNRFEEVFNLFPILKSRLRQKGGTMSGGEQQMLALARALMADPELLMLDEPSLGLAPLVVREVFRIIKEINNKGKTILLIEQSARLALKVSNYGFVLENAKVAMSGQTSYLLNHEQIRKIYLGEE
jgi:branched-chain amino acid transport system ATP-binding protein